MKNKKILAAAMAAAVAFSVLLVPQFGSVKAANTNLIKNGNFEDGNLSGYLSATEGAHNVKVVNEAQDGHSVELDGYAAYLFGRGENGGTDSGFLTTEKTTLAAGSYVWTFDVNLISGQNIDEFVYGVYTGLAYGNRGYGSGSSIGKSEQSVNNYEGHAIKGTAGGSSKSVVTVTFNLAEETGVYFSFGFSSKTVNTVAYVDNLKLAKVNVQDTGLVNGDFESGDLTGYLPAKTAGTHNVSVVDAPKDGHNVTLNGSAAYLSGRGSDGADCGFLTTEKITLPAGSYVWTFDVDLVSGEKVDEFIYGVYTGLLDWANRGYGSGSSIGYSSVSSNNYEGHAIKGTAGNTVHSVVTVTFNLATETGVYLSLGFSSQTVNTVAYVDNLKLSKASVIGNTTAESSSFTPDEKDGYFIPYGSVVDGSNNKLVKNADGSFSVSDDKNISFTYFKTPVADGITTFGVSNKKTTTGGSNQENMAGIQFGSYTENAKDKKFYTLIIRGVDVDEANALTYGQKNDMVNTYLSWISGKENKDLWGKYTRISGKTYEIKVVEQQKYMWKNSDGSKLQYAVRLYGDYSGNNADVNFSAIGLSKSENTVSFADSFKTASYSSFN